MEMSVHDLKRDSLDEKKYYIPSIEEFHIGFEYEKYDERKAFYVEDGVHTNWHKFVYDTKQIRLSQLVTHLHEKQIRVKNLDEKDIDSLLKEKVIDSHPARNMFKFSFTNFGVMYILLMFENKVEILEKLSLSFLFCGTVKNKSELKRILNQVIYKK